MSDKIRVQGKEFGVASIVSKFNWNQQVFFLKEVNIIEGKVMGVRGDKVVGYDSRNIEICVVVTSGNLEAEFWISEGNVFSSKDDLIKKITNG